MTPIVPLTFVVVSVPPLTTVPARSRTVDEFPALAPRAAIVPLVLLIVP